MENLKFNTVCIDCIYKRFLRAMPENIDEMARLCYAKGILRIIAEAEPSISAPEIVAECTRFKNETFGYSDDFAEVKEYFNRLMLGLEGDIEARIEKAADPFGAALRYALLGNYIDFGAMERVDESKLRELIDKAESINIDKDEQQRLRDELKSAQRLVYLTDNCGEIVFDKLFIRVLKKSYPQLNITALVRGESVLNDATMHDAEQVGLTEEVTVLPNGTPVAGTCIDRLPEDIRKIFLDADMVISKGQGNFETLCYSQRNIYYIFMCKCKMFAERFDTELLSPMLLNDLRMN